MKRKIIRQDPEARFAEPNHVLECNEISPAEKLAVLENWRTDLIELQQAADENMPSANAPPGASADMLSRVCEAIEFLRRRERAEMSEG